MYLHTMAWANSAYYCIRYYVTQCVLLFSILHTTPFPYRKTYFGALQQFHADATRLDTPWGSKPPHLQVGACLDMYLHTMAWANSAYYCIRYYVTQCVLLFSILHTTPFPYRKTYFGALQQFHADATRLDTPWGSKPPHLQVGVFKSLQIQYVPTRVLLLLMCSVS